MITYFLILHKVRGDPAFDVAHEMTPGVWIVSTSGHRAYPFKKWTLPVLIPDLESHREELPFNWPDHYSCNTAARKNASVFDLVYEMLKEKS